jgi:hypothetical protein
MEIFKVKENRLGKSVYSTTDMSEGAVIFRFTGQPMRYEDTKKLGGKESFALQTSIDKYIYLDKPSCFFNHSCEPNTGLNPDLFLIALRRIEKGEELNYDYSTTMLERDWNMKCTCGKPNCRKVIMDFDRLPEEVQNYYLRKNVVQRFIVQRMKEKK